MCTFRYFNLNHIRYCILGVLVLTLLYFGVPSCLQGRLEIRRHKSLFSASLVHSDRLCPDHSFMLSHHCALGLPLGLLPSIRPSRMFFIIDSCRLVWPKNFIFRDLIVFSRDFSIFIFFKTSSFLIFCFQLIFPIRLMNHISQASIFSINVFARVHVSQPYRMTEKT